MSTVVSRRTRIVSSNTPRVAAALAANPSGRVIIPFVFAVSEHARRVAQARRATVPVDSLQDHLPHKGTAASRSGDGIDLTDDRSVQFNVHSHVYIISTFWCAKSDAGREGSISPEPRGDPGDLRLSGRACIRTSGKVLSPLTATSCGSSASKKPPPTGPGRFSGAIHHRGTLSPIGCSFPSCPLRACRCPGAWMPDSLVRAMVRAALDRGAFQDVSRASHLVPPRIVGSPPASAGFHGPWHGSTPSCWR